MKISLFANYIITYCLFGFYKEQQFQKYVQPNVGFSNLSEKKTNYKAIYLVN